MSSGPPAQHPAKTAEPTPSVVEDPKVPPDASVVASEVARLV